MGNLPPGGVGSSEIWHEKRIGGEFVSAVQQLSLVALVHHSPKGRHFMRAAACPGATCLSRVARRLAFVLFAASRWRKPGVRRSIWPVPVILKRFATDFLVFCIGEK